MGWIKPRKRTTRFKNPLFSGTKYADYKEFQPYFRLQKRKEKAKRGDSHRPEYRIIWLTQGGYPYYTIAQGENEEKILQNEWNFITTQFHNDIKNWSKRNISNMEELDRRQLFKKYFTGKAQHLQEITNENVRDSIIVSEDDHASGNEESPEFGRGSVASDGHDDELFPSEQPPYVSPGNYYADLEDPRIVDLSQTHWIVVVGITIIAANAYVVSHFLRLIIGLFVFIFILSFYLCGATYVITKFGLILNGILFMTFGKDKKWDQKSVIDPDKLIEWDEQVEITFIRHGRSDWNHIFNEGLINILPRLIKALVTEIYMFSTPNSIFFDSPLNSVGIEQAEKLRDNLSKLLETNTEVSNNLNETERRMIEILNGKRHAIITTSPLRRAYCTIMIGLEKMLKNPANKMHILSSLQEISTNVDCIPLTKAGNAPNLKFIEADAKKKDINLNIIFDTEYYQHNKTFRDVGLNRLKNFADWVFEFRSQGHENEHLPVIVGGHSLWFRSFFRTYLPRNSKHKFKTKKICNGGAVSFKFRRGVYMHKQIFRIDEESIYQIYPRN